MLAKIRAFFADSRDEWVINYLQCCTQGATTFAGC